MGHLKDDQPSWFTQNSPGFSISRPVSQDTGHIGIVVHLSFQVDHSGWGYFQTTRAESGLDNRGYVLRRRNYSLCLHMTTEMF